MRSEQFSNTRVVAPISGVVSERPVSAGDVVQPGGAMFTVVDPSSMRLEASIPADQLASVRVGVPVTFTVNGYPGRSLPVVSRVLIQLRIRQRVRFGIIASIPNTQRRACRWTVCNRPTRERMKSGLIAPVSAIDLRSTQPAVMRIRQGKVERVPVQLGLRDEGAEKVEIKSGVAGGRYAAARRRSGNQRRNNRQGVGRRRTRPRHRGDSHMVISDFAIKRPMITVVVMVALVDLRIVLAVLLQTDEFPDVRQPVFSSGFRIPGALLKASSARC